ncbi:MAG: hypothetical protein Q7R43_06315 [Candidatus Daviesbacteria bacterium]|nr:hypothetical protein [Candidatus Daviesbacteria bacterium]
MECLCILKPTDRIWIGDQTKSIPEGLYDRIYKEYGSDETQVFIALRKRRRKGRSKLQKVYVDLDQTLVYVEHRYLPTSSFADSQITNFSKNTFPIWKEVEQPTNISLDSQDVNFSLNGNKISQGSDNCQTITTKRLLKAGITKFNIRANDGEIMDSCKVKKEHCLLVINPRRDKITICYRNKQGQPAYASVKPSQIEDINWERLYAY